ncbi:MAG: hypothetical protein HY543_09710 [Deltaproteobacteria bacterium]|nr:hypothetical protein [Deltaproteobacteria bacterium]
MRINSLLISLLIAGLAGCGGELSFDPTATNIPAKPAAGATADTATVRLVNFGGWAGTATSENFILRSLELVPYNARSATSSAFALLPTTTVSPFITGGQP